MFLILFLPFLSSSTEIPKFSYILVGAYFIDDREESYKNDWAKFKNEFKKSCKKYYDGDTIEKCIAIADGMQDIVLSDGQNIDHKLSTISKKTEFLFYINKYNESYTINFNNLNEKMVVFCLDATTKRSSKKDPIQNVNKIVKKFTKKMIKSSFDGSQKGIIRLSEQFKPKKNKITKSTTYMKFYGDINDKVSFLTIANANVSFIGNINCESLYLDNCNLSDYSDEIRTNYFIVDPYTHSNIRGYSSKESLINVKEYAITQFEKSNDYKYQIQYGRREWYVSYTRSYNDFKSSYDWSVPYKIADTFSIIVYSLYIDINANYTYRSSYPTVNLTIVDNYLPVHGPLSKETVRITSSGDWSQTSRKPKVIITVDKSIFDVEVDPYLEVPYEVQEIYSYKVKSSSSSSNLVIIICITVACVVVVIVIIVIVVVVVKKKKKKKSKVDNKSSNGGTSKTYATTKQQQPQQTYATQYQQSYQYPQGQSYPPSQSYIQQRPMTGAYISTRLPFPSQKQG